ncbi:hypothetical protein FZO89_10310 [Luteimonas viscosa]|uniref:Ribosomal protein L7/L12 C-terminal domain-containing protein n=1 Tax=Luteimonas viscosa TaxID=1132694 RepID=A0A5D4XPN4_9GAMM|nr:hypothetical protein [Luteimonas viscosa]TYT26616.1 hypothetical protein FZO89_10310 [Luteimonas viscosa]
MSSRPPYFSPQTVEAIARGRTIEAIRLLREDNALGLREAKAAVDAYAAGRRDFTADAPHGPSAAGDHHDLGTSVDGLLREGQVIEAVRQVRAATGMNLKDARDWVEARRAGVDPEPQATPAMPVAGDPRAGATVQRDSGGRWIVWAGLGLIVLAAAAWWLGR